MIRIREVILVEGRYDKNTLSQIVDGMIIETAGFGIFHDPEKQNLIRNLAETNGVVILTDSDGAGLIIRNYLKGILPADRIKNAYIPEIPGKEKRKTTASKEGTLGVEGMTPQILLECLRKSGATILEETVPEVSGSLSKTELYQLGLIGKPESSLKRKRLLNYLQLPTNLSANALVDYLKRTSTKEELIRIMDELDL